jgi:iron complex outermembrane recepter protein
MASSEQRWWRSCRVASLFACWLVVGISADAQPSGHIAGAIRDDTGAPLPGVTITLHGPADRIIKSDAEGRFTFQNLADGAYELTATLAGFAPASRRLRLVHGGTEPVLVTLSVGAFDQTLVTASKTGERDLQTTPMAVTVLGASELQRVHAHTVADVAGRAPSVTFSQNSDYGQLTMRGIGSNTVFAGSDPSSAVYVDGVYLARPVMALEDFLDIERVEFLRGPQGTLYGRNAVGGALNLISRTPSTTLEASARIVAGDFGTLRGEARVSGPIIRDRLMGSAVFLRAIRRGFVTDLDHPDHPLGAEDITAARSRLRLVLNRRSDLLVSGDLTYQDPTPLTYAKVLAVKPGFQVDNPRDPYQVRASTLAESRNVQYGGSARLTVSLTPTSTVTSLTAFRKLDYNVINDADITELDLTAVDLREIQHQVSEEVTVSHDAGRLAWIGGLFLLNDVDRQPTLIRLGQARLLNFLNPHVDASSEAGFGQATFRVMSRLSVTGGLRFTRERKVIDNAGQLSTIDVPVALVPGSTYAYTDAISHTAWTPKVGVEVRTGRSTFAYLSATRGFKSGGFNFTSQAPGRGFAPEWAWSYEGGLKTTVAGGRARLNIAGFLTDYTDLQVQTAIRPGVIDISNAAAATIRGLELENTTEISHAVQAGGHFAWLDATYDRYLAVGVGGITGDVRGNRLNNAPQWSGGAWLQWSRQLGGRRALSLRADSTWQSTVFYTPFNDSVQWQRPYGLLDLSADFGPKAGWTIGVYGRNLANQDYITGSFGTPPPAFGGRPGLPRQLGVQLVVQR